MGQQHLRGGQRGVQAQGAARVRIKIVEHIGDAGGIGRRRIDEDAGAQVFKAGQLLAAGRVRRVTDEDEGGVAAAGLVAEAF